MRGAFHADVDLALRDLTTGSLVTESELTRLPRPIQRYLRKAGVVGHPHVLNMRARMHGRIRSSPSAAWMPFVAEQYSFFRQPARYFYMKASRWLVPIHVYHRYAGTDSTMRVKVFDQLPVAAASGPDMTRAETVTMFNDMCLFAPATLIDPAIEWQAGDDSRTRATFRNAGHTIRAELSFNAAGELVNFRSDDRLKTNPDGTMRPLPWSTPLRNYRAFGDVQLGSHGEAVWHESDGPFAYAEIEIDEVSYNVATR